MAQPIYPDAEALSRAPAIGDDTAAFADTLEMPKPPARISRLFQEAPPTPAWDRLAYVRKALRDVAVAAGGGAPGDVPPERVVEILDSPTHEASPYEIVAAETMLARWAGIPARIGFGFDGVNDEGGVMTVRPANAAQWLEVYFEGHGWVPLIEAPKQAKSELDEDTKIDPDIVASDQIAAEIVIPIKLENFKQLYQKVRDQLLALLPFVGSVAGALPRQPLGHARPPEAEAAEVGRGTRTASTDRGGVRGVPRRGPRHEPRRPARHPARVPLAYRGRRRTPGAGLAGVAHALRRHVADHR